MRFNSRILCWLMALAWPLLLNSFIVATEPKQPDFDVTPGPLGAHVNPFIGTGGASHLCGNNFPGATVPFGMVRLSPDTVSPLPQGTLGAPDAGRERDTRARALNKSGYYYPDSLILGFSHTRLAGTGAVDGGNFSVFPSTEPIISTLRQSPTAKFSHEQERAFPGYYGVVLKPSGIKAEMTSTCRVGFHRYTFPVQSTPRLFIDVTSILGRGVSKDGEVRILPEQCEVEGAVTSFGTFSKRYGGLKTYFVAKINRPVREHRVWVDHQPDATVLEARGNSIGVDLGLSPDEVNPRVELKLAVSYVSIQQARANLEAEAGQLDFKQALAAAVAQWEEMLSRIKIEGGTDKQRSIFLTGLYHSLQMPTLFNDANGKYLGFDKQVHQVDGFQYYTDMSMWDTFRTVHPLFNLIAPREQRDMLVSLMKMAQQGGYLPRWPSGGGYTNSMFGTPADMVITESYLKGIRDFDVDSAFQYMKKTALAAVPPGSAFSGRVGVEHVLKHGYGPADLMKKSVASTIEYCYADLAIADLATALGHHEDAALFRQHGRFYQKLFNPESQFFQPRNADGNFSTAFKPEMMTYVDITGQYTHAYVEGSAWQWRWGVPSDADEVVKLFKSPEYFVDELNKFFSLAPGGVSQTPNSYYWHGNQPDIYAAFLFNHAGRPDLTQKWSRWILDTKYSPEENGIDGNDDGGTLSAFYVLCSLGLYPTAGTDRYEIGSPIWQRAEIKLKDKPLIVITENNSAASIYVRKVWLNDQPLDRWWIRHAEIAAGGMLRFEMAATP